MGPTLLPHPYYRSRVSAHTIFLDKEEIAIERNTHTLQYSIVSPIAHQGMIEE
jgi:hypothetical protein